MQRGKNKWPAIKKRYEIRVSIIFKQIMKRKHFIRSITLAGAAFPAFPFQSIGEAGKKSNDREQDLSSTAIKMPDYLQSGDTIGITAPAGYILYEEIMPAISEMAAWGLHILTGSTIGKRDYTFAGSDEQRAADLQHMLDNDQLKAIMCARGGYGLIRIIDRLDFTKFIEKPKWLIGFSDATVLLNHLYQSYGIASIHSKMCNSFPDDFSLADAVQQETILSIRDVLFGGQIEYQIPFNNHNRSGIAQGPLIGGNFKTIESLYGSKSAIVPDHTLLFLEDTGEYLYSIDRMFWNLKRSGRLAKLKGLIVGGFKIKPDDPGEEFGKTIEEIVLEKVQDYNYPVCFDFPVGHQKNNFAIKHGVKHTLIVSQETCSLTEST